MMRSFFFLLVTAAVLTAGVGRADSDHDRARAALEKGEIVPLAEILDQAARDFSGEMVEVELEREHDRWVYEIKLLCPGGRVVKAEYDARTKELLKYKGKRRKDLREGK